MKIRFFRSQLEFQKWLGKNHGTAKEIIAGFYKKGSGKRGITYAEALDVALCLGWIDGVRRSLDAESYSIRFSPRKAGSIWSRINLNHVERLTKEGRMLPAGIKIHAGRVRAKEGVYSFENAPRQLSEADEITLRSNGRAHDFFERQAPSYQRVAIWWVVSAKKEETRERRLRQLIQDSAEEKRLKQFIASKPSRVKPDVRAHA